MTDIGQPFGLGLSGGGYRATIFHLGVLRRLNELGVLSQLTAIASVSGGSILNGLLALAWRQMPLNDDGMLEGFDEHVAHPTRRLCSRDIRTALLLGTRLNPLNWPKLAVDYFSVSADYLATAYAKFYGEARLLDLPEPGLNTPRFIFCATNVRSGDCWQFHSGPGGKMGDFYSGYCDVGRVRLAEAVAASSAFTPGFSALRLRTNPNVRFDRTDPWGRHRPESAKREQQAFKMPLLTDGGVYDNLGIQPLWGKCSILASDDGRSGMADTTATRQGDRTDDVQAAADKVGGHLYNARIRLVVVASRSKRLAAREKIHSMYSALASLTLSRLALFRLRALALSRGRLRPLVPSRGRSFFLSHVELATIFHPATSTVQAEQMARMPFTELKPPVSFATDKEDGGVVLGRVQYRSDDRTFGLTVEDRRRHLYVVGRTGVGKTTLLENLIRSDIAAGRGVCLIDPHGDLADTILASIPTNRTNDVIVFDPSDPEQAIAFNPLACREGWEDRVTSGVVTSFKKIYDSWGPRLEDTLRNTTYLAVEHGGTLFDVLRLLTDDAERNRLLSSGRADELSYRFWTTEFARWNDRYRTEAVAAILNKVRPFLMNRNVRAVVSQKGRGLDLRQVMDEGKIVVANLSKGQLGEDNANLLGALLVTSIQQAAMSRADIPEEDRRDFYFYFDEFQNFSTGSFADILSEARKYRLSMTLAHQYTRQLDETTADAVFGNVGSMVVFQVGSDDAELLTRQLRKFPDQIMPEDLTNIPKYHAYCRLLQQGMPEHPFSMATLPPKPIDDDRSAVVRRASNDKYARPKADVLANLGRCSGELGLPSQKPTFIAHAPASSIAFSGSLSSS